MNRVFKIIKNFILLLIIVYLIISFFFLSEKVVITISNMIGLFAIYSGVNGFTKKINLTVSIFYIFIGIIIIISNSIFIV